MKETKSAAEWLCIALEWAKTRSRADDDGVWVNASYYLAGELAALELKYNELEKKYSGAK